MRALVVAGLAVLTGILFGLALSEVIGIVGVLAFHRAVGIRYLPVYLAIGLGIMAPLADAALRGRLRRRSRPPAGPGGGG